MSDTTATIDTYLAAWNETDPAARADLVKKAWAEEGAYVDPLLEAQGHEAINAMAAGVHQQFPGFRFRRTSGVDAHHSLVRFGWELVGEDGAVAVAGIDIAIVADDGRLSRVAGFFGDLPEMD